MLHLLVLYWDFFDRIIFDFQSFFSPLLGLFNQGAHDFELKKSRHDHFKPQKVIHFVKIIVLLILVELYFFLLMNNVDTTSPGRKKKCYLFSLNLKEHSS